MSDPTCPVCRAELECEVVGVGTGTICGPPFCPMCGWSLSPFGSVDDGLRPEEREEFEAEAFG